MQPILERGTHLVWVMFVVASVATGFLACDDAPAAEPPEDAVEEPADLHDVTPTDADVQVVEEPAVDSQVVEEPAADAEVVEEPPADTPEDAPAEPEGDAPEDPIADIEEEVQDDVAEDVTFDVEADATAPSCEPDLSGIGEVTCDPGCTGNQYCDYPDDRCGSTDAVPTCQPRPEMCTLILWPTCGCDLEVHSNPCVAQSLGVDVNVLGGCDPPREGLWPCGAHFCLGPAYCQRTLSDEPDTADLYSCEMLPAACSEAPSCACLAPEMCAGGQCEDCEDGGVLVTCPPDG